MAIFHRNSHFGMEFIQGNCYIPVMMHGGKTLVFWVLSSLLLGRGAQAIISIPSGNPYQGITDRNIFGLKPPPAAPNPEDAMRVPPPKIKLTGITTILGKKQALLMVEVPAKPPQAAREESFIMTEGQREGEIEVLNIDVKAGTVKVDNRGTPQTLDFVNNGVKLPASAAGAAPGPIPHPALNNPMPGGMNPGSFQSSSGGRQIPLHQVRGSSSGAGGGPPGLGAQPVAEVAPPPPQSNMTMEQHSVLIELQRAKMQEEGDETAKILPPTEFTPGSGESLFPQ
jgi:hypothetical protein